MTAEELLAACRELGLMLRVDDNGQLCIAPREKLTDDLRATLRDHKEAVIALLNPVNFENPRSQVKKLEKELGIDRPPPSVVVFIDHGECEHAESDIQMAMTLLKQERMNRDYDPSQGFCFFLDALTKQECDICRILKRKHP